MKKTLVLATITLSFVLVSCTISNNPTADRDFTHEIWKASVEHNPNIWKLSTDTWFWTGEPNAEELANRQHPSLSEMTTSVVRTASFHRVESNGDFQIQIFQSDRHSVFVYGPNAGAHAVGIESAGGVLRIRQTEKIPQKVMRQVIVRIGIQNLTNLLQLGSGPVSVSQIRSKNLCVESRGAGNIYLSGDINLRRVISKGAGCIFIFGADTCLLDISTSGSGMVNIYGSLGVRSIIHHGSGNINLIGVRTKKLSIYADGTGKIGLCGWYINLCAVTAKDNTCVYVYNVFGDHLVVNTFGRAQVGLIGKVSELYVNTRGSSVFLGRDVCAQQAFVTALGSSHINVNARFRTFARASESGSIYFFGPETLLDSFVSGSGEIVAIGGQNACNCDQEYRAYAYTCSPLGENVLFTRNNVEESCSRIERRPRIYRGAG